GRSGRAARKSGTGLLRRRIAHREADIQLDRELAGLREQSFGLRDDPRSADGAVERERAVELDVGLCASAVSDEVFRSQQARGCLLAPEPLTCVLVRSFDRPAREEL